MAEALVKIGEVEGKRENSEALNLEACGQLVESVQRLKMLARVLWEMEELDKEERGTLSIMLSNETDNIFMITAVLEARLEGVRHG